MLIDAHMHLIEHLATFCGRGEGRPIGDGKVLMATGEEIRMIPEGMGEYGYSAESCIQLMNEHKVDLCVLLQSGFYGFQNDYIMETAKKYPRRFYPVASLDPYCNQKTQILDNFVNNYGFCALKFEMSEGCGIASYHAGFKVDGPEMREIYEIADKNNMTIAFDVGGPGQVSYQIEGWRRVFKQYKNIRFVVCHLLAVKQRNQPHWEEEIKMLATENAWFDIAALSYNLPEPYPYFSSIEHMERAACIVGSERLVWGSDAPFVLGYDSYENLMSYFGYSKVFSQSEKENILGKNAITAYNIPIKT